MVSNCEMSLMNDMIRTNPSQVFGIMNTQQGVLPPSVQHESEELFVAKAALQRMSDAADRAHDRHRMLLRAASGVSRGSPGMSAIAEEPDEPVVENSFWNLEDLDGAVWDPDLSDTEQAPDEDVDEDQAPSIFDVAEDQASVLCMQSHFASAADCFSDQAIMGDDADEYRGMPPLNVSDDEGCGHTVETFCGRMAEQQAEDAPRVKRRRLRHKQKCSTPPIPAKPSRKLHHAANSRGVPAAALRMMIKVGLPMILLNSLTFIQHLFPIDQETPSFHAELFTGVGQIAESFEAGGCGPAGRFDILRHSTHEDICGPEGFLSLLRILRCCCPGGLAHWATVCSTWIYLSRASTDRSRSRPLGDLNLPFVCAANTMLARVCLAMAFAACLRIWNIHEQPVTSLVPVTKFVRWLKWILRTILNVAWFEEFTWLGAYGHETQKPTQLIGTAPWIGQLRRSLSLEEKEALLPDCGVRHLPFHPITMRPRVSGAQGLKSSQAYPRAYGQEVFKLWRQNYTGEFRWDAVDVDEEIDWDEWRRNSRRCNWSASRLDDIAVMLGIPGDFPLP